MCAYMTQKHRWYYLPKKATFIIDTICVDNIRRVHEWTNLRHLL